LSRWLAACLVVLVAGCAAAPVERGSPAQARLSEAQARAAAFARSGDYAGAARFYAEALRIATSLENADAIAANALNLSIVDQWLGRDAEARAALAAVLDEPRAGFSERRKTQAELRRAILEAASGDLGAAEVWAAEAERRCATTCEYAAAILNLRAQLALDSGHAAEAARLAVAALERAPGETGRPEAANALRTLGGARIAAGQPAAAREALGQALEIDRGLGDPRKILADLTALARAADAAGDAQAARGYKERSVAVSRAINDRRSAPEPELLLRR
jgi:tetratricopeptide (TPR) repeat protein